MSLFQYIKCASGSATTGSGPGNSTPGNSIPGNSIPGNGTPGNSTPGNSIPGNGTPGNSTQKAANQTQNTQTKRKKNIWKKIMSNYKNNVDYLQFTIFFMSIAILLMIFKETSNTIFLINTIYSFLILLIVFFYVVIVLLKIIINKESPILKNMFFSTFNTINSYGILQLLTVAYCINLKFNFINIIFPFIFLICILREYFENYVGEDITSIIEIYLIAFSIYMHQLFNNYMIYIYIFLMTSSVFLLAFIYKSVKYQ